MVPVRLELKNFLSYGTNAPPLDFDAFEVACLSGKNGQGKSALLDALTWAVWGEARKSSGRRKPDEELIRIGTREMVVAFTFDLEGARYRVTRSFSRSATGKTTSSDLEFQIQESEGDSYRPLTGGTQRETQARIEDTIGLSYDTFINSAFLLQGRSDEFTKKRPSERKEILANVLNLSRYEALRQKASDRWRDAKDAVRQAAAEVERLDEALADVPEWKAQKADIESKVEAQQATLATLREEREALTERRATLASKAREAESTRTAISGLEERIAQHEEEVETLAGRVEKAEVLIAQREEIQDAYDHYEALQEERDALDEKRDLHRGIEKQIEKKEAELERRKNEKERTLDRLTVERKNFQQSLNDCTSKLSQRSAVRRNLKQAMAARQTKEEMEAVRDKREALKEQIEALERELVGQRQQLQGELDTLRTQIRADEADLAVPDAIEERIETLAERKARYDAIQDRLDTIEAKGKRCAEKLKEHAGQLEARREERERQREVLERVRSLDQHVCPTCGTDLTPAHQAQVEDTLRSKLDTLDDAIASAAESQEAAREQRNTLRTKYTSLKAKRDELEGVSEELTMARDRRRAHREQAHALARKQQRADALRRTLEAKDYGAELRTKRQALKQKLRATSFDAQAYDDVQTTAAQVDRYRERLQELEELEGRKDELERKIQSHTSKIESVRQSLDDGSAFGDLPDQIESLRHQLDAVDFDPERFQTVRQKLQDLSGAGARMKDLVHAQQNRAEWKQRQERLHEKIEAAKEEKADLQDTLDALEADLDAADDVEAELNAKTQEIQEAEATLNDLQQTLGKLSARLETAAENQKKRKAAKERHADAKQQRALYKHLRTAFGKNGIPSLIIEETLPDIEERANALLDRLTDGKMHVRLETLRDKKTGGTKETLEIIITDERGVARPYETFSGGESFRVNFALRLALAQLLAERSGVRVRTLVIDEGFGTQDEEGIERLVESIQAVREDFAKILVITHLERLKQAFPVRIEVEKDPTTGSSFELVGA